MCVCVCLGRVEGGAGELKTNEMTKCIPRPQHPAERRAPNPLHGALLDPGAVALRVEPGASGLQAPQYPSMTPRCRGATHAHALLGPLTVLGQLLERPLPEALRSKRCTLPCTVCTLVCGAWRGPETTPHTIYGK